ncbi:MAG TPA: MFS transporter, partial [Actinomycetes bacterium]|nr:MFS transporter [Actinomycetes bacterium]
MRRPTTVGVLVLAAAVGFLLSLYGPSIPELRAAYGVGGGGSALVLSLHFAGAMTGIGWWGLERRLAPRTWLVVAATLAAGGAVGIAFAPAWPVVLAAAFGLGVGFGVVVVEINVLFAEAFGERTTAMLNLLGACFGAGAILGPLAVAASGGYRLPFCVGAGAALASLALAGDLPRTARPPAPAGDRPPFAVVWGFVALCALYVGVENGIGG